jgi:hypothetical protein
VHGDLVSGLRVYGTPPWYSQGEDQWFLLDTGTGELTYFREKSDLEKAVIEGKKGHR